MTSSEPTPITYDRIKEILETLSDRALERLAKGPHPRHPTDEECRVCEVLENLPQSGAEELHDWHNYIGRHFAALSEIARGAFEHGVEETLTDQVQTLVGELSYLRCLVIYACADAELEKRNRQRAEEEPDERDATERRRDEEQDAAERRLDSSKAGDLDL